MFNFKNFYSEKELDDLYDKEDIIERTALYKDDEGTKKHVYVLVDKDDNCDIEDCTIREAYGVLTADVGDLKEGSRVVLIVREGKLPLIERVR